MALFYILYDFENGGHFGFGWALERLELLLGKVLLSKRLNIDPFEPAIEYLGAR